MARPSHDAREPQDQRLIIFALLSLAILMFWNANNRPPVKEPDQAANQDAESGEEPAEGQAGALAPAPEEGADNGVAAVEPNDQAPDGQQAEPEIEAVPDAPLQSFTLGSADPDGRRRMLLTLTNRGAALRRLGLSSPKFSDIDRRAGSLGVLDWSNGPEAGVQLGVVGPGTAAARAGLAEGDIILSGKPLDKGSELAAADFANAAAFREWLSASKPGEEIEITVAGNDASGQANRTVSATLARPALQVIRPESENVLLHQKQLPQGFQDTPSLLIRLAKVNGLTAKSDAIKAANKRLTEGNWKVEQSGPDSAQLSMRLADLGLELVKHFRVVVVPEDKLSDKDFPGYHFEFEIEVRNLLGKPQSVAYVLEGPSGLPIEGYWYANKIGRKANGSGSWGGVGLRDVVVRYQGGVVSQMNPTKIAKDKYEAFGQGQPLAYIGIDAQYFATMLIPQKETIDEVWFDYGETKLATQKMGEKIRTTLNNPTFTITRQPITLPAADQQGATRRDSFTVFAGPKRPELLAQYHPPGTPAYNLSDMLYYGWFSPVARLMLNILHSFYSVVQNYGLAILLLTVVVRLCMYPLSRKQAMNMVKMQELKPEIDRIAEKHKTDMEKRSKAQQELFRKHNYNPMGGCLLMFIQLPIFLGLYRALAVDVELREAPLVSEFFRFCSNLAAPDMFYDWSWLMPHSVTTGVGFFGLGPYLNLLPIVTIVLFLAQQKMFMPEPTNEQAAMQQKMMKYMMIFMGFMFFKVPSGLCIYFIASSLWGITERKLLPHPKPAENAPQPPKKESAKKPAASSAAKPKQSGGKKKKRKR